MTFLYVSLAEHENYRAPQAERPIDGTDAIATIPPRPDGPPKLTPTQRREKVIAFLDQPRTSREIMAHLDECDLNTVRCLLSSMRRAGLVERDRVDHKSALWRRP